MCKLTDIKNHNKFKTLSQSLKIRRELVLKQCEDILKSIKKEDAELIYIPSKQKH